MVIYAKYHQNLFRSFVAMGGGKLMIASTLAIGFYQRLY